MNRLIIFIILISTLAAGCAKSELNADEYVAYVESGDNKLANTKEMGDLKFSVLYCPAEYTLLQEYKTNNLAQSVVDNRKKENDSIMFFKLRISEKGNSDVLRYNVNSDDDYYARIQYLSFGFEEDIAITNGKDTIFPAEFHFERTYGVTPFADFILAFHTKMKPDEDFQLLIDDKVFNTGVLKFSYKNKDIQNIPKLKTN